MLATFAVTSTAFRVASVRDAGHTPAAFFSASSTRASVPLSTIAEGTIVEVARISEEAERDMQLLGYLDIHGVKPGACVLVTQVAPWLGTIMLRREDDEFPIGLQIATKIHVRPLETPARG